MLSVNSISDLSKSEILKASKILGQPPNLSTQKFTGGEFKLYLKIRKEFMANINGKGVKYLIDYSLLNADNQRPFDYGSEGENIVQPGCVIPIPNRTLMIDNRILEWLGAEEVRHESRMEDIDNLVRPLVELEDLRMKELDRHYSEVSKIETTSTIQLENQYETARKARDEAERELIKHNSIAYDLFTKYFCGMALIAIQEELSQNEYMRAFFKLDQAHGLKHKNIHACQLLRAEFANTIFNDSTNLKHQIDNFKVIITLLRQIDIEPSDLEKRANLVRALSNNGIIHKLYNNDISYYTQPRTNYETFDVMIEMILIRYTNLSTELAALKHQTDNSITNSSINMERLNQDQNSKPRDKRRWRPYKSNSEKVLLSKVSPINNANTTLKCTICGRTNHKTEDCWKNKSCTVCGKKGHSGKFCRRKQPEDKGLAQQFLEHNNEK
jgi:hypothetical protein